MIRFADVTCWSVLLCAVLCLAVPGFAAEYRPASPAGPTLCARGGAPQQATSTSMLAKEVFELTRRGILVGADHDPKDIDIFYDDFYVQINGGPVVYYTSAPVRMLLRTDLPDPGALGHFYSRDDTTYSLYITATDYTQLTSDLSDPLTVYFNYDSFGCAEQTVPVADAGPDQVVRVDTEVTLDGTGSYDPYGPDTANLVYIWECYSAPEIVALRDEGGTAITRFIPHTPGHYYCRLTVRDILDGSPFNRSRVSYARVTVVEDPGDPNLLDANAGPFQEAEVGAVVTLDGSKSRGPSGSTHYHWEQTNPVGTRELEDLAGILGATGCTTECYKANYDADPDVDGSDIALLAQNWGAVTIIDSDQPIAHFLAGIARPHVFTLTVSDAAGSEEESTVVAVHHPNVAQVVTAPDVDPGCLE